MVTNRLGMQVAWSPGDAPGQASSPPLREEYGGPRQASDGTRVTPDGSEPGDTVDAPATPHIDSPSEKTPPLPVPPTMPPPVPPNEPQPVPVDDPPVPPDVPYIVRHDNHADTDREPSA